MILMPYRNDFFLIHLRKFQSPFYILSLQTMIIYKGDLRHYLYLSVIISFNHMHVDWSMILGEEKETKSENL